MRPTVAKELWQIPPVANKLPTPADAARLGQVVSPSSCIRMSEEKSLRSEQETSVHIMACMCMYICICVHRRGPPNMPNCVCVCVCICCHTPPSHAPLCSLCCPSSHTRPPSVEGYWAPCRSAVPHRQELNLASLSLSLHLHLIPSLSSSSPCSRADRERRGN